MLQMKSLSFCVKCLSSLNCIALVLGILGAIIGWFNYKKAIINSSNDVFGCEIFVSSIVVIIVSCFGLVAVLRKSPPLLLAYGSLISTSIFADILRFMDVVKIHKRAEFWKIASITVQVPIMILAFTITIKLIKAKVDMYYHSCVNTKSVCE